MDSIAQVIGCIREGNTYQEDWEKKYESYVLKDLYRNNFKEAIGKKKVHFTSDMLLYIGGITQQLFHVD